MQQLQMHYNVPLLNRLALYIEHRKYECLLLSFMWLIFGNTFSLHSHVIGAVDIYQNLLIGCVVFYKKKWLRNFILCVIFLSVSLDFFESQFATGNARNWLGMLYLVFFFLVAKEVYKEVLYSRAVSRELLAAALCGFVLLCLITTFLFYLIEMEQPHSFLNAGEGRSILTNLDYFSFTTLLTIGYGDIAPVSIIAKRAVMFAGLTGHFYTVFVTSIIIGKYLSGRSSASAGD